MDCCFFPRVSHKFWWARNDPDPYFKNRRALPLLLKEENSEYCAETFAFSFLCRLGCNVYMDYFNSVLQWEMNSDAAQISKRVTVNSLAEEIYIDQISTKSD